MEYILLVHKILENVLSLLKIEITSGSECFRRLYVSLKITKNTIVVRLHDFILKDE